MKKDMKTRKNSKCEMWNVNIMKHKKQVKLYEMFNDINRVSKKHLNETHDGRMVRKAKEYSRKNNVENGMKETFSTGTRTWKNFGIFNYEKPTLKEEKPIKVETEEEKENKKTLELELRLAQLEKEWRKKWKSL